MANHNPEDSAGAQLAMMVALQLLLSQFQGNALVSASLESALEEMRALLLASPAEERKIASFEAAAGILFEAVRPRP